MSPLDSYFFVSHASSDNALVKDVIEVLLDAGVRLWFDRPQDIGIPAGKFVAKIEGGEDWEECVELAAKNASGMICFVSNEWVASEPCRREFGFAHTSRLSSNGDYWIGKVFLRPGDHRITLPHDQNLQGYEIIGFHSPEVGRNDRMTRLLAFKDDLLRIQAARKGPKPVPPRSNTDVLYSINRSKQIKEVRNACETEDQDRRWPLLVYLGDDQQCLGEFRRISLGQKFFAKTPTSRFAMSTLAEQTHRASIQWNLADAANNPALEKRLFQQTILTRLRSGDPSTVETGSQDTDLQITEIARQRQTLQVLTTEIVWDPSASTDLIKGLTPWFDYWQKFPFEASVYAGRQTLLPTLQIVVRPPKKNILGFLKRSPEKQLVSLLEKWRVHCSDSDRAQIKVLTPLGNVTPECLRAWLDSDDILHFRDGDHIRPTFQTAALVLLQQLGKKSSMRAWANTAKRLLDEFHIELATGHTSC